MELRLCLEGLRYPENLRADLLALAMDLVRQAETPCGCPAALLDYDTHYGVFVRCACDPPEFGAY